jgi:hypothetical protein
MPKVEEGDAMSNEVLAQVGVSRAKEYADALIKIINDDHTDLIRIDRETGCLIRDHINDMRAQIAALTTQVEAEITRAYSAEGNAVYHQRMRGKSEAELATAKGAISAQDEREANAGVKCGVAYELSGCDWPDAVADEVLRLKADLAALREVEPEVRMQLWLTHGCGLASLYGDDGEMQCNRFAPFIDFKRGSLRSIIDCIAAHNNLRVRDRILDTAEPKGSGQ